VRYWPEHSELVYGLLGKDSIRTIWLQHPTIIKLREALHDEVNYPPICRGCVLAKRCRTGCVAQNFVNGQAIDLAGCPVRRGVPERTVPGKQAQGSAAC